MKTQDELRACMSCEQQGGDEFHILRIKALLSKTRERLQQEEIRIRVQKHLSKLTGMGFTIAILSRTGFAGDKPSLEC